MLDDKLQVQDIPRAGGPQTTREGAGATLRFPWEDRIINLWVVLRLADQQPVLVCFWFRLVHDTTVCRHLPHGEFSYALWERYLSQESHAVVISHPRSLQSLGLL